MRRHHASWAWRGGAFLTGLLALAMVLAAWQGLVDVGLLSAFSAPPPSAIAAAFPALLRDEGIGAGFAQTFSEALAATLLAASFGLPLGWLLHRSRDAGLAFEGWWASLAAAPLVLL